MDYSCSIAFIGKCIKQLANVTCLMCISFSTLFGQSKRNLSEGMFISGKDKIAIDSLGYHGKTLLDTLYFKNNQMKAVGHVAVDRDLKRTAFKTDFWTDYYPNGQIKSQGNYQIDYFINCCNSGPCVHYSSYKIGEWKYFYEDGHTKAIGHYNVTKDRIKTTCNYDFVYTSHVDKSWTYYDISGTQIKLTPELKLELEAIDD